MYIYIYKDKDRKEDREIVTYGWTKFELRANFEIQKCISDENDMY